jgi:hypothetical protein
LGENAYLVYQNWYKIIRKYAIITYPNKIDKIFLVIISYKTLGGEKYGKYNFGSAKQRTRE